MKIKMKPCRICRRKTAQLKVKYSNLRWEEELWHCIPCGTYWGETVRDVQVVDVSGGDIYE